jgi:AcrR family transcriptional regulator
MGNMAPARAPRPARKRADRYHHGDLRRALLQAAVRAIHSHGVDGLTLRQVGSTLGVSRTALYRHFADKSALLSAVAAEGFRMLRLELVEAWETGGRGRTGFEAMGMAYVQFAVAHPSHYRVMFSADVASAANPELTEEGASTFQALVDSLIAQQHDGLLRGDDPLQMARFVWANVHGIAMLAIDRRLAHQNADVEEVTRYSIERIRTGIAAVTT